MQIVDPLGVMKVGIDLGVVAIVEQQVVAVPGKERLHRVAGIIRDCHRLRMLKLNVLQPMRRGLGAATYSARQKRNGNRPRRPRGHSSSRNFSASPPEPSLRFRLAPSWSLLCPGRWFVLDPAPLREAAFAPEGRSAEPSQAPCALRPQVSPSHPYCLSGTGGHFRGPDQSARPCSCTTTRTSPR